MFESLIGQLNLRLTSAENFDGVLERCHIPELLNVQVVADLEENALNLGPQIVSKLTPVLEVKLLEN